MRAALYMRISREDLDLENQRAQLRPFAESRGWEVTAEFTDILSGSRCDRDGLKSALAAAERREYDVLVVWATDRLSREGAGPVFTYLQRLSAAGVKFHSFQEPLLSTAGPMGDIIIAIYATFAKMERDRLIERTNAGIAAAKEKLKAGPYTRVRNGRIVTVTHIGRAKKLDDRLIYALLDSGKSMRAAARELSVGLATVQRAVARRRDAS